jgi:ketosteroid isomerase-like protein
MRRRLLFALVLMFFVASPVVIAQDDASEVRKVLNDQVDAWNAGSVEGYMKGYWNSDSTAFVSGGTLTKGYNEVLARYKKSYDTRAKMGRLEFEGLLLRQPSPTLIIATGVWKLHRTNDSPWGRFTLLIEKKSEGWRIVYDHTSSAAQ